jgi:hypothetical protein
MPGAWDPSREEESRRGGQVDVAVPRTQPDNLIAGIINDLGMVVDDTGKAIARITDDHLPINDLVGHVVTATGNILGDTGEVVGRVMPLNGESGNGDEPIGLIGALIDSGVVSSVTNPVGHKLGETVDSVTTLLPVSTELTRIVHDEKERGAKLIAQRDEQPQPQAGKPEEREKSQQQKQERKPGSSTRTAMRDQPQEKRKERQSEKRPGQERRPTGGELVRTRTQGETPFDTEEHTPMEAKDKRLGGDEQSRQRGQPSQSAAGTRSKSRGAPSQAAGTRQAPTEAPGEDEGSDEGDDYVLGGAGDAPSEPPTTEADSDAVSESDATAMPAAPESVNPPDDDEDSVKTPLPFTNFPDARVGSDGRIMAGEGSSIHSIGMLASGSPSQLKGRYLDSEGNIINETGTVVGRAELKDEIRDELRREAEEEAKKKAEGLDPNAESEEERKARYAVLKGARVNKGGNLVNEHGQAVGRLVEGILAHCIGRKADENGDIWNDAGKVMARAEPIPETELQDYKEPAPFEDFEGATVESDGRVMYQGEQIGIVVEGDPKKLKGKRVDPDGDILDKNGNVLGHAERWDPEPEAIPEPEAPIDRSILAGKRVNKAGNVVDSAGVIYGRIVEGDINRLAGRMCDREGNVRSESGDIIGRAELIPEGEREGFREGAFAELPGCTVNKDGLVVMPGGDVVGRLIFGDPKVLQGRQVDQDGDILDRNGNVLGRAERWEPEAEPEKPHGPMFGRKVSREGNVTDEDGNVIGKLVTGDLDLCAGKEIDEDNNVIDSKGIIVGHVALLQDIPEEEEPQHSPMYGRKVNKEGNVVDEDGNIIGKLTSGVLSVCAGKTIDDDGDVVDSKGTVVGHVSLLSDIEEPEEEQPEVEETEEEKAAREQLEEERKLAKEMAGAVEQCLERIRPICKMIEDKIQKAERTPKEELDEEELVRQVKPLIEEGGKILTEANGVIRSLDPDGHIAANAKARANSRDATPEEYHLADVLKELTGTVTTCIDNAKRMIEDMPHAKEQLNPLWGLLTEPLFQILAGVGLVLNGVLELVGGLLNGLGLGGIVNGLLGGLGLSGILKGLGLGGLVDSLTGKNAGKKKGGGQKGKIGILGL